MVCFETLAVRGEDYLFGCDITWDIMPVRVFSSIGAGKS